MSKRTPEDTLSALDRLRQEALDAEIGRIMTASRDELERELANDGVDPDSDTKLVDEFRHSLTGASPRPLSWLRKFRARRRKETK